MYCAACARRLSLLLVGLLLRAADAVLQSESRAAAWLQVSDRRWDAGAVQAVAIDPGPLATWPALSRSPGDALGGRIHYVRRHRVAEGAGSGLWRGRSIIGRWEER